MSNTWECIYCSMNLPLSVTRCECGTQRVSPVEDALQQLVFKIETLSIEYDIFEDEYKPLLEEELEEAKKVLNDKRRDSFSTD